MNVELVAQELAVVFPEVLIHSAGEKVQFNPQELTPNDFTKLASVCSIYNVRPYIKRSGTGLSVSLSPFKKEVSHG